MLKIKIFQMKKNSINFIAILIIATTFFSCNKGTKFEKTDSGIEYAFVVQNEDSLKPTLGDAIVLDVDYYYLPTDSLLFSSSDVSDDFRIEFVESQYEGSIDEAFALMSKGDSAIFYIDAVKFFKNATDIELPSFIKEGDKLSFHVKLQNILTKEQVQKEEEEYHQTKMQEEKDLIAEYIKENEIVAEQKESGLYFIEKEKGRGVKVKTGDSISVNYTGYFINGEVFDSTSKTGEPFNFRVGVGQVIQGWDEGLTYMNQGGKALLIIPCEIGYGFEGYYPYIPPYSTLIFEISVEKVF
jgi:FKBP-type peptidyl-prolyl cis-trans isomerase FkpA